ncbi:MAG TPA: fructosamine kinase family protein [Puia sp.]|nr:fructosamine kinase family protein [Puia sp.]
MNTFTALQQTIQQLIFGKSGGETSSTAGGPLQFQPLGGGSINAAYKVLTQNNSKWFCKVNDAARFPGLFEKESRGLQLLRVQNIFRVPKVIACEIIDGHQILVLEWIDQDGQTQSGSQSSDHPQTQSGPQSRAHSQTSAAPSTDAFWQLFGKQLAQLHLLPQDQFGLEEDNYMGALPQDNTPSESWTEFFIQRRLEPQVKMAVEKGLLPTAAVRQFWSLYLSLPEIFPDEAPSLLHGDLWSGNFLKDDWGEAVLIDPAVYRGHRAMTTLFGGFSPAFYQAYAHYYPLPTNHREQWEVANLYPLLIHLNLFGKSYLHDILHTIERF